jgi:hypothetical protein
MFVGSCLGGGRKRCMQVGSLHVPGIVVMGEALELGFGSVFYYVLEYRYPTQRTKLWIQSQKVSVNDRRAATAFT